MDDSDREARQQAGGSQGAKGSGTDFGPTVRGQDTTQGQTDRAQRDAGGSQVVGQQFPGLDDSDREARQQADGSTALKERRAAERISDRLSAVKTPLKSRPIALRQTAAKPLANSSPAWTKAVEKLRSRQTLLERAATAGTTDTAGTLNRMRDALRRDASMGARLALPPQDL